MNIKLILFISVMVLASNGMGENGNDSRKRKSKYLLIELRDKTENMKAASDLHGTGKIYLW